MTDKTIACVDLFCGAGGLTHGLKSAGINVAAGIDHDETCRFPYATNNSAVFIQGDMSYATVADLSKCWDQAEIRILAGCPPCQPFSTYSQRYQKRMAKAEGSHYYTGPRWGLLYSFGALIAHSLPHIVVAENVSGIVRKKLWGDFINTLTNAGYYLRGQKVDCSLYGLPQTRKRQVLLASRIGPIELLPPSTDHPTSVREAIGHLPPIAQGETHPDDPLHTASKLSDLNLRRIQASQIGGTWRDWPEHLIADCHRRDTGYNYKGVYGRMSWNEPAPTLTTRFNSFGNGRYGHPEQDRAISIREGAILQGFPESYAFVPDGTPARFEPLCRQIGNAVPVTLGKVIGQSIIAHVENTL